MGHERRVRSVRVHARRRGEHEQTARRDLSGRRPVPAPAAAPLALLAAFCASSGCYPDFQFETAAAGGASSTSAGDGGTGGTGGLPHEARLPCGKPDAQAFHERLCEPGQSCCFDRADDTGSSDFCAEAKGCGESALEYACRTPADCGALGTCCSRVESSSGQLRLRGSGCKFDCGSDEAELCDPYLPASTCGFRIPCEPVFGAYGACLPPDATGGGSSSSSSSGVPN